MLISRKETIKKSTNPYIRFIEISVGLIRKHVKNSEPQAVHYLLSTRVPDKGVRKTRQEALARKEHFTGKTTEKISVESLKYPRTSLQKQSWSD